MSYQSRYTGAEIDEAVREAKSLIGKSIVFCSSAVVGQTIVVDEVDENGKPIKWKAVDMSSGDGASGENGVGIQDIQPKSSTDAGNTYTITLTDGSTYDFTAPAGPQGVPGPQGVGEDGVSATVSVKNISGGHRVTITHAGGTDVFDVMDGKDGTPGADGKTPVKGTDYFTAADKKEIAEQAAELVEVPEGFSGSWNDLTNVPSSFTPAAHNQAASTITSGTFAGQVVAGSSYQTPGTYLLRNSLVSTSEATPTVNGQISWLAE